MDLLPCSSSRRGFFDRISRDAYSEGLVVILTILTFLTSPTWLVIWFIVLNYSVKFQTAHTPQTPTNCEVMTDL